MAMGTRKQREKQEDLWIAHTELAAAPGHPFYQRLNELLEAEGFDEFVEGRCAKFYAEKNGRPSLTPGIYFRALLIGYFEGIGAEHGITWRLADSLALRRFVGIALDEYTPDHSTISRTRRLIDLDTHREVFAWVLGVLADRGLLKGQRIAIDATTLEANAAMRSIVRRDTGESYEEFLRGLAKASGIATLAREDLARLDRKRRKRTSNKEWKSPADGDARIAKMKDGRTHLAHKAEHAVDLDTGAVVAVTLQGPDKGGHDHAGCDAVRGRDGSGGAGWARGRVTTRPSAEGERGRDRRDGDRQGLSQRRGGEADEGVWRVQLHSGKETEGAAELGGQTGGTASGVCEPATGAGRVRQEFIAAEVRIGGAQLRALLRDGRAAALPSARTGKHSEAATDPRGSVQSQPDPTRTVGRGHAAGVEEPRGQACFDPLLTLHLSAKSEVALQKRTLCVRSQVLCEIAYPTTSPDLPEIRYLHPGLLDLTHKTAVVIGGARAPFC